MFKAVEAILDMVPSWVYAAIIAALVVSFGIQHVRFEREVASHATTKQDFADYKGRVQERENVRAQFALQETDKQREIERFRNKASTEANNAYTSEIVRATTARVAAAERRRVFNATYTPAAGTCGGQGSGDSAAVCRAEQRADAFWLVLETCRAERDQNAGELEALAGQVRGLKASYNSLIKPLGASPPPPTPPTLSPSGD